MEVYKAINKVQAKLSEVGIAKDSKNEAQKFMFRSIDQIYNTISGLVAEAQLCILPRMIARTVEERTNKSGTALFYVTVEAEFDLVSAADGSKHTVKTFGEAMDSGDKATNKAMSAAYKYACIQTFCIPTEGDNDADATTHEVQKKQPINTQPTNTKPIDITDDLIAIEEARDLDELQKTYTASYNKARAYPDALQKLTEVKDRKKKILGSLGGQ
jgi:glutamine synthetase